MEARDGRLSFNTPVDLFYPDRGGRRQKRRQVMMALERHLIEARPVWKPMHLQPLFNGAPYFAHTPTSDVSARLFQTGICLPSGSNMSETDQDRVINHLRHALTMGEERHA